MTYISTLLSFDFTAKIIDNRNITDDSIIALKILFITSTERRLFNWLTQSFFIVKCEEHITFIMYRAEIKSRWSHT